MPVYRFARQPVSVVTGEALGWWLLVQAIGLVALPITLAVFRGLPGAGYAFSKPLGILLTGYLFWMALSLHVLPNRPGSVVWVLFIIAGVSAYIARTRHAELRSLIEERLQYILAVEVVFAIAFAIAVYLKSFLPEISGTEKPMDFMLLNAASRSRYYAPDDAWLAGYQVSYYYFGYVINAMIGKLASLPTAVTFNVALAGTAALATTAAFGLGYELVRLAKARVGAALAAGLVAALFVTSLGNLEGVVEFAVANGYANDRFLERLDIAGLEQAKESEACFLTVPAHCLEYPNEESSYWWWWRATRISPDGGTITEFPFFSFLLGDLHPHVMAIPYVLTAVGLVLALSRKATALDFRFWRRRPFLLVLSGVVLGGLGFLNTWDLPTVAFLLTIVVLARSLMYVRAESQSLRPIDAIEMTIGFMAPLVLLAFLLYTPFYLSFDTQASGFEPVTNGATRPLQTFLFWTPLVLVNAPLPIVLLARDRWWLTSRRLALAAFVPAGLLALWALAVLLRSDAGLLDAVSARGWNWLTALFYASLLTACILALWRLVERRDEDEAGAGTLLPLAMLTTSFLLILGAELFYVRDVFNSRLNTVFKLYYQAWLLLAVSGAFSLYWLLNLRLARETAAGELLRGAWSGVVVLVIAGALLYPMGATLSRTEDLSRGNRTLDGLAFARRDMPDDYAALDWLRARAGQSELLVEATGGQYSAYSRVSAWTGIPTLLGWSGHEIQWGRDGEILSERQRDIETIFNGDSLEEALALLRKYGVTYLFVGSLENGKYPPAALRKFEEGLPAAFRSGRSVIYRVPVESNLAEEGN